MDDTMNMIGSPSRVGVGLTDYIVHRLGDRYHVKADLRSMYCTKATLCRGRIESMTDAQELKD